jgi:hypothetical protein
VFGIIRDGPSHKHKHKCRPDYYFVPHEFQPTFSSITIAMSHTIVLLQPDSPDSRTYSDYDTVTEAMEGEDLLMLCVSVGTGGPHLPKQ